MEPKPCPRRAESPMHAQDEADGWRNDQSCTFCGSLNPDMFMARLEAGDVELGPTDKNYKVYVENRGGAPFKQTYWTDDDRSGDQSKWVWVTREVTGTKFYFRHLSETQMQRFIELLNEKKLHIGIPGYFYTKPFFIQYAEEKG